MRLICVSTTRKSRGIATCAGCAHKRATGVCWHIPWAASKFTPNLFVTRKDKPMTITSPARTATPRIRMFVAPLLLAAAGATAIAFSPLAEAASTTPACFNSGNASVCQTEGNAQVTASTPSVDYQAQYPFFGYGDGLLFHHRGHHG